MEICLLSSGRIYWEIVTAWNWNVTRLPVVLLHLACKKLFLADLTEYWWIYSKYEICLERFQAITLYIYIYIYIYISNFTDCSLGWPECSLFNSYNTEMLQMINLPLICTLWLWVLRKKASTTLFWVFSMTTSDWTALMPPCLTLSIIR